MTFSLYRTVLFLDPTPSSNRATDIHAVYGSNNVIQPKDGPFGVRTMGDIIWEKCAPKNPEKGGQ